MKSLLIAVALMSTVVYAQTPVITNADLGKPAKAKIVMTPAQWQNFVDHQTKIPPSARRYDYGGGANVAVSNWTMPTAEALKRPTYPLQTPFYMSTYVGPTIGVYALNPSSPSSQLGR